MANANLTLCSTANIFLDWLTLTNNEANSINELRNGNYYKDNGNFTVANGTLLITSPTGTTLSVTANVSIANLLTTNTLAVTGNSNFTGNIAAGNSTFANINVSGTANIGSIIFTGGTISTLNVLSQANIASLNVSNISVAIAHRDAFINVGLVTANSNINCAAAVYQDLMLCSNPTITFQNTSPSKTSTTITLYVRQSSNGSNTVTWSNTIRWSDNSTPILSTTQNTADMFTFTTFNGGTIWFGIQVMGNVPGANIW